MDHSGPSSDRRRQRGERSRVAILEAAMRRASVDGLEGLTIGRLATDLGISKSNIGVLFGDKQNLQMRTIDFAMQRFVEGALAPLARLPSPVERLKACCMAWFDFVERRILPGGCLLYASISEFRARPGAVQDRVKHHFDTWTDQLRTHARDAAASGHLQAVTDVDQLVFDLIAYQSAANAAYLLGDWATFRRARRSTLARIAREEPPFGRRPARRAAAPAAQS
jgi:AcrR family transcriptional regulator